MTRAASGSLTSGSFAACGELEIDLGAIRANYEALRARIGSAACGGVVKADCYGLGAERIAPVLHEAGCRHFFVAHLEEGLALRPLLPGAAIYVLNGLPPDANAVCADAGLVPVLNAPEQIVLWRAEARRRERLLPAVLQVDTGMSRLGLSDAEQAALATDPQGLAGLDMHFIMSHLACADEPDHSLSEAQLERFRLAYRLFAGLPGQSGLRGCFANSAGIFLGTDYHFDCVRPGMALYGLNPLPEQPNPMRPVVRLSARVVQTRVVSAGARVGYGYTYTAPRSMRLATLAVGYADGWHRALGNRGAVFHAGQRLPIVGRVSMDSMIVDIDATPEGAIRPGDRVELIGPHQTADDVATAAGTIGYEILTALGSRYKRLYRGEA